MNMLIQNYLCCFLFYLVRILLYYIQVDKHIRKLDADLARFEADLKDKSSAAKLKSDSDSGKKSEWNFKDRFLPEEKWFISAGYTCG